MRPRQFRTTLRENRLLVGGVVVVCVVIAAVIALLVPRSYTSSAIYYVNAPSVAANSPGAQGVPLSAERVSSYAELIAGPRVAADASALLGGTPSASVIQESVASEAVSDTVVINVEVTRPTPQEAQTVALAVTEAFTRLVNRIESGSGTPSAAGASVDLIFPPTMPDAPNGPGLPVVLLIGLVVGVVLGVGAALVRRAVRRTVDLPEAVASVIDAPVLSSLPALPRAPRRPALLAVPPPGKRGRTATGLRARAAAVRRLRTGVLLSEARCLVVSGAREGQGTTTTAIDLAIALAAGGESVVLVDADLRTARIATVLNLPRSPGLVESLGTAVPAVVRWSPGGIDVLTAGAPDEQPNDLWSLPESARLLTRLREEYAWVVLDASSAATEPDVLELARHADGVLLVVRRGSTRPEELESAAAALRLVGTRLIGAAFTWASERSGPVADAPLALPPGPSAAPVAAGSAAAPAVARPVHEDRASEVAGEIITVDAVDEADTAEVRDVEPHDIEPEPAVVTTPEPAPEATPEATSEASPATEPGVVTAPEPAVVTTPATEVAPQAGTDSPDLATTSPAPSGTDTPAPGTDEPESAPDGIATHHTDAEPHPAVVVPSTSNGTAPPTAAGEPAVVTTRATEPAEAAEPSEPAEAAEPSEPAEVTQDEASPEAAPTRRRRGRRRVTSSWPTRGTTPEPEPDGLQQHHVEPSAGPDDATTESADHAPSDSGPATPTEGSGGDPSATEDESTSPAARVYVPAPGRNGRRRALASRLTPRKQ